MTMNLCIAPQGRLFEEAAPDSDEGRPKRITEAFTECPSRGILHLSTAELQASFLLLSVACVACLLPA
jgi:hypothetical protein